MDQSWLAIVVILLMAAVGFVNGLWIAKTGKHSLVRNIIVQVVAVGVLFGAIALATGQLQPALDLFIILVVPIVGFQLAKRQLRMQMKPDEPLSIASEHPGRGAQALGARQLISFWITYLKTMRWQGLLIFVLGLITAGLMYISITPRDVSVLLAPLVVSFTGLLLAVLPTFLNRSR